MHSNAGGSQAPWREQCAEGAAAAAAQQVKPNFFFLELSGMNKLRLYTIILGAKSDLKKILFSFLNSDMLLLRKLNITTLFGFDLFTHVTIQ